MGLLYKACLLFAVLTSMVVSVPITASAAWDPFGQVPCSGEAAKSAVCQDQTSTNPLTGPNGMLVKATHIIGLIAGAAAVIMMIIGGFRYVTSAGDSNSAQSAKNTIMYALIGLLIIAVAQAIISFVLSRI